MSDTTKSTKEEPWLTNFELETGDTGNTYEEDLAVILKDFILDSSADFTTLGAMTARKIDTFYRQEYLTADPLMKFQEDKGLGGFLWVFYELVCTLAKLIPYNDITSKQDKLVTLLAELRKLPPQCVKIWHVSFKHPDAAISS